ncbi:MAG: polysaccharide deacetylase family protein [Ignavibacteriaceae bacterium]|nr:polysaccharide deacetylase family protein [Ignavibacteriaceae bacterium]
MILLILFVFIIFFLNYILPHLVKKFWRRQLLKWVSDSGKIFLTFDDGPEISTTGQILDFLKTHNIRATFFVLGVNVEQNPALTQRILMEGHTIGIHGENHLHPWKILPWKGMSDLYNGNKILKKYGIRAIYVRPPYGKLNLFSLIYILINRLTFIHWNLDPKDYNQNESTKLSTLLKDQIQSGKIILLHDGRRPGTFSGDITVKGLESFLQSTRISPHLFSQLPINGIY